MSSESFSKEYPDLLPPGFRFFDAPVFPEADVDFLL